MGILFFMEETWEHVSVHWQQGNYQLWANYLCAGTQFRSRASEFQGNSATRHYAEGPNHATMTRPSKMHWNYITHPVKQRADSEQDAKFRFYCCWNPFTHTISYFTENL